ncbi:hypothetical protein GCM10009565_79120 [Amycolatopsis albidoflavus]
MNAAVISAGPWNSRNPGGSKAVNRTSLSIADDIRAKSCLLNASMKAPALEMREAWSCVVMPQVYGPTRLGGSGNCPIFHPVKPRRIATSAACVRVVTPSFA